MKFAEESQFPPFSAIFISLLQEPGIYRYICLFGVIGWDNIILILGPVGYLEFIFLLSLWEGNHYFPQITKFQLLMQSKIFALIAAMFCNKRNIDGNIQIGKNRNRLLILFFAQRQIFVKIPIFHYIFGSFRSSRCPFS